MLRLKSYRDKAKGLSDLLPYAAMIGPGIILCKDGSLLSAWEYRGQDTDGATEAGLDQIASMFTQMISELDSGWLMHVDSFRKPTTGYPDPEKSHFPDPITQMIEDERREFFSRAGQCFQTSQVMSLAYRAPDSLIKDGDFSKALAKFQETVTALESFFRVIPGFDISRLDDFEMEDESGRIHTYSSLLSHIQHSLTGILQPLVLPEVPMYLDAVLGGQDVRVTEEYLQVGSKYLMIVAIDGLPNQSYPEMLGSLDKLAVSYRFSSRFIFMDYFEAKKKIINDQKAWNQQTMRAIDKYFNLPNPKINYDAVNMRDDAEEALTELRGREALFGYLTSVVVLLDEDLEKLKREALEVLTEVRRLSFGARLETYNLLEAWQGSWPGHWLPNVRKPVISTNNLPHLLPLASVWAGADQCPCPFYPQNSPPLMICTTDGSTPFRLNLHDPLDRDRGHTLIFGPTGSGKSTLLATVAAQFRRYPKATIFAFDKGFSMFALALAAGGDHFDVGGQSAGTGPGNLSFAPLQRIDESEAEFAWAANWIASLIELQGLNVLPNHRNAIHEALTSLKSRPPEMRALTDFKNILQGALLIKEALQHYCQGGAMGHILDSRADNLSLSRFMVFEIEELMDMGDANLIPVLLYLFRRVEKALKGQPALLILDEAWRMFKNEIFKSRIIEWLKVMRKNNCAVVLATQNMMDAINTGIMGDLSTSCPTKIFLANHQAEDDEQQRAAYESLGLNSAQIGIIRNARPKMDYYVTSYSGRRLIRLALGPKALAFTGVSSKDGLARIRELRGLHGDEWSAHWLAERLAG